MQEQQQTHKNNFTLADPLNSLKSPFTQNQAEPTPPSAERKDINYLKRLEVAEYLSHSQNLTDAATFVHPSSHTAEPPIEDH